MTKRTPCPVAASCRWHNRAATLLRAGAIKQIQKDRDILLVLLTRAWRGCTCGLDKRIRAVL